MYTHSIDVMSKKDARYHNFLMTLRCDEFFYMNWVNLLKFLWLKRSLKNQLSPMLFSYFYLYQHSISMRMGKEDAYFPRRAPMGYM